MKSISHGLEKLLRHRLHRQQAPTLGRRELEVMKILWREDELSAQAMLDCFVNDEISLSTMQSTLERLCRKKLVSREKAGRYYLYRAATSQSAIIAQLLGDIAEDFSDGDMAPMISGFMSFIDQEAIDPNVTDIKGALQELSHSKDD